MNSAKPTAMWSGPYKKKPRERAGLVPDHPDRVPVQPGEADDDVLGVVLVDLEELSVVHHMGDENGSHAAARSGAGRRLAFVRADRSDVPGRTDS